VVNTRITVLCRWKGSQPVGSAFFSYYVKIASNFHIVACGSREQCATLSALKGRYPILSVSHMEGASASQVAEYFNTKILRSCVGRWVYLVESDEYVELPFLSGMETICELESSGAACLPAVVLRYAAPTTWVEEPVLETGAQCPEVKFPLFYVTTATLLGTHGVLPHELRRVETALQGVIHWVPASDQGIQTVSTEASPFAIVHRSTLFHIGLLRRAKCEPSLSVV
jgi:hypothetical protein